MPNKSIFDPTQTQIQLENFPSPRRIFQTNPEAQSHTNPEHHRELIHHGSRHIWLNQKTVKIAYLTLHNSKTQCLANSSA